MSLAQLQSDDTLTAYERLAPYYDDFTAGHRYDRWTATIERLARYNGLDGRRHLDLACGTGKSSMPFADRGFAVTGVDFSPSMLAVARQKLPAVSLVQADIRALPPLGEFDLITCLHDVVNYLPARADRGALFGGVAVNLAPEGVFVFDTNTLRTYAADFCTSWVLEGPAASMRWVGGEDGVVRGGFAEAAIEIRPRGGSDLVVSTHRQRHHDLTQLAREIEDAGLSCLAIYGQDRDGIVRRQVDESRHTKALFFVGHPRGSQGR
jgi:SAM-dependent methyltransferase